MLEFQKLLKKEKEEAAHRLKFKQTVKAKPYPVSSEDEML